MRTGDTTSLSLTDGLLGAGTQHEHGSCCDFRCPNPREEFASMIGFVRSIRGLPHSCRLFFRCAVLCIALITLHAVMILLGLWTLPKDKFKMMLCMIGIIHLPNNT